MNSTNFHPACPVGLKDRTGVEFSKETSEADSTGTNLQPVKFIEDEERSGFNRANKHNECNRAWRLERVREKTVSHRGHRATEKRHV